MPFEVRRTDFARDPVMTIISIGVSVILVAGFEEATGDLGRVIDRLNLWFGTDFAEFDHTEDAVAALMARARKHLGPNPDCDTIKDTVADAYDDPSLERLRARAEAAHATMLAWRDAQLAEGT